MDLLRRTNQSGSLDEEGHGERLEHKGLEPHAGTLGFSSLKIGLGEPGKEGSSVQDGVTETGHGGTGGAHREPWETPLQVILTREPLEVSFPGGTPYGSLWKSRSQEAPRPGRPG